MGSKSSYIKTGGQIIAGDALRFECGPIETDAAGRRWARFTGAHMVEGRKPRPFIYSLAAGGQVEPIPGYLLRVDRITEGGRVEFTATAPVHIRVVSKPKPPDPAE